MAGEGYQYINMLLDKQKTQAQLNAEATRLQAAKEAQMLKQMQDAANMVGDAMKQTAADKAANQQLNEMIPPRAEAADPALAKAMKAAGMGPTKPHTGGVNEFNIRMTALQRQDRLDDRAMAQQRYQLDRSDSQKAREFDQEMASQKMNWALSIQDKNAETNRLAQQARAATNAARMTDQKTKNITLASDAYLKQKAVTEGIMRLAQKDGNWDVFNQKGQELQALHLGGVSSGLKLPPLELPKFQPPGEETDLNLRAARQRWDDSSANAFPATGSGWSKPGSRSGGKTAGDEYMEDSDRLYRIQQKYAPREVDRYTPPDTVAIPVRPPGWTNAPARGASTPPQAFQAGTTAVNRATGARIQWNGRTWESVQ